MVVLHWAPALTTYKFLEQWNTPWKAVQAYKIYTQYHGKVLGTVLVDININIPTWARGVSGQIKRRLSHCIIATPRNTESWYLKTDCFCFLAPLPARLPQDHQAPKPPSAKIRWIYEFNKYGKKMSHIQKKKSARCWTSSQLYIDRVIGLPNHFPYEGV